MWFHSTDCPLLFAQFSWPRAVEALILDWSRRPNSMLHRGLFREEKENEADAPARTIVLRGAAAVPDLMALLDDRRITVHEVPAVMKVPARIRRVGELAGLLLEEITGIRAPDPAETQDVAALRAWLEKWREMEKRSKTMTRGVDTCVSPNAAASASECR